ncbi:phosphate/phosphite/phosphonate ABC transporter substrate-binding protein [Asticcacaulis taihuensis]|uniref:phosphate/phosphite/phosphonate ABC transporter substrate-binding protein n=1 Tax=Asticcacaulis taihuensis TaxID=260084 RepID=UPI0026EACE91|nr:phosphate/phosphite/phosphonate ABC transporter substrate-binding protein [Asticcacaulis taihuensis]
MTWYALSRKALASALITACLGLSACERLGNGIEARREIAFSVLSSDEARTQVLWAPVVADLQKQTGLKVKIVPSANYEAQVLTFQAKKAQAGWFTNLTGAEVLGRGHGAVFAEAEGIRAYQSLIIAPAASKLKAEDLLKCNRKLSLGLGERRAAASGQAPFYYFFQPNRIDMKTCFKAVTTGTAEENIEGVISGKLNAAAVDTDILQTLQKNAPTRFARVKVIWASQAMPEDVLIYRDDLDPVTREKLRSFFLSYGRAPGAEGDRQRNILKALELEGFAPEDDDHFIPIRLMKASVELMQAERAENKALIAKAKARLEQARADKRAADAATAPQAPADARPASLSAN